MRDASTTAWILCIAITTCLASITAPSTASAQARIDPLAVGTRVRVTSPALSERPKVATILVRLPDGLAIRNEGMSDSVAVPFASITEIDVSNGSHTHVLKGMGIGFIAGTSIGAISAAATYRRSDDAFPIPDSRAFNAFVGGVIGAVIGPLIGGVTGALWRTEQWTPVSLASSASASARLQIGPPGSTSIGLSLTF